MPRTNGTIRKHSFRATIRKRGPNPYVEVPERISRAMAGQARAGYIRVAGTLDHASIRATLVPTGGGHHRLYVNGAMQAAAGVTVGDTVTFHIQAMRPETVRLPSDLAAALRQVPAARTVFDVGPPSHRREWLRYIDDARTPGFVLPNPSSSIASSPVG